MIKKLADIGGKTPKVITSDTSQVNDSIKFEAIKEYRNILNFLRSKGVVVSVDMATSIMNDCIRNQEVENIRV